MRTGVDLDHLHPLCSANVTTTCLPLAFDGNLLQIMPWPTFQNLNDHDIRSIYEYLSAIPCIEGPTRSKRPAQRLSVKPSDELAGLDPRPSCMYGGGS